MFHFITISFLFASRVTVIMMKRYVPHSWTEQQVLCDLISLWRTDGRYFCATVHRPISSSLLLAALSKCVKQDMCHHFSTTDWWFIFNQHIQLTLDKKTRQLWEAWHFFSCCRVKVIAVFLSITFVWILSPVCHPENDDVFFWAICAMCQENGLHCISCSFPLIYASFFCCC